ncbi:MAG: DUF2147 domain-containing protein [Pseudomonadota bacterium]
MHTARTLISALFAVALGAAGSASASGAAPTGAWISEKGGLVLDIQHCGEALCGTIVWLKKPYRKNGELRRDAKNDDPSLRDRPWCGITVIRGARPDGDGRWGDGTLYDPKRGATFGVELRPKSADEMDIRAYAGLRAFGKTERFVRSTDGSKTGCSLAHAERP